MHTRQRRRAVGLLVSNRQPLPISNAQNTPLPKESLYPSGAKAFIEELALCQVADCDGYVIYHPWHS